MKTYKTKAQTTWLIVSIICGILAIVGIILHFAVDCGGAEWVLVIMGGMGCFVFLLAFLMERSCTLTMGETEMILPKSVKRTYEEDINNIGDLFRGNYDLSRRHQGLRVNPSVSTDRCVVAYSDIEYVAYAPKRQRRIGLKDGTRYDFSIIVYGSKEEDEILTTLANRIGRDKIINDYVRKGGRR
ncbi:MAG: hypothetical protein J6V77_00905 [Clostridia bacterium]|nr:hypothetical protein [Clostridia bacterium]MBO7151373.1 hypothetical protein [Clostridia bacterium]MBO7221797.1 hypothetical protein [Clostridia bacterium]MBO7326833.1 hypothetical protein [Clostridia bacterium]